MDIVTGMAGHGNASLLVYVFVLSVTAARPNEPPPVGFD
jgi:hypothetical protein